VDKNINDIEVQYTEEYKIAFNLSLRYLTYKPRSEKEVVDYLIKKDFPKSVINKVIVKLKDINYIDDVNFTKNFISNSVINACKGRNLIISELINKGIRDEIINQYLYLYSFDNEKEIATKIAKKYFLSNQALPIRNIKDKLYNRLMRKGFSHDSIYKAFNYLENDTDIQYIISQQEDVYETQAYELAQKYYLKYSQKEENFFKLKQKIYYQLIRKGFDYSLSNKVVENIIGNN